MDIVACFGTRFVLRASKSWMITVRGRHTGKGGRARLLRASSGHCAIRRDTVSVKDSLEMVRGLMYEVSGNERIMVVLHARHIYLIGHGKCQRKWGM